MSLAWVLISGFNTGPEEARGLPAIRAIVDGSGLAPRARAAARVAAGGVARTDFTDVNLSLYTAATAAFSDTHVEQGQEKPRGGDRNGTINPF